MVQVAAPEVEGLGEQVRLQVLDLPASLRPDSCPDFSKTLLKTHCHCQVLGSRLSRRP